MIQMLAVATAAIHFAIPSGKLADRMGAFALQAEMQVLYKFDGTENLHTQGVEGVMTPSEALHTMLIGTDLFPEFVKPQTVTLKKYWSEDAIRGDEELRPDYEGWAPPPIVIVRATHGNGKQRERVLPARAPVPGCVRLRWLNGMVLNRLGLLAFDMQLMQEDDGSDALYCYRKDADETEEP